MKTGNDSFIELFCKLLKHGMIVYGEKLRLCFLLGHHQHDIIMLRNEIVFGLIPDVLHGDVNVLTHRFFTNFAAELVNNPGLAAAWPNLLLFASALTDVFSSTLFVPLSVSDPRGGTTAGSSPRVCWVFVFWTFEP